MNTNMQELHRLENWNHIFSQSSRNVLGLLLTLLEYSDQGAFHRLLLMQIQMFVEMEKSETETRHLVEKLQPTNSHLVKRDAVLFERMLNALDYDLADLQSRAPLPLGTMQGLAAQAGRALREYASANGFWVNWFESKSAPVPDNHFSKCVPHSTWLEAFDVIEVIQ